MPDVFPFMFFLWPSDGLITASLSRCTTYSSRIIESALLNGFFFEGLLVKASKPYLEVIKSVDERATFGRCHHFYGHSGLCA